MQWQLLAWMTLRMTTAFKVVNVQGQGRSDTRRTQDGQKDAGESFLQCSMGVVIHFRSEGHSGGNPADEAFQFSSAHNKIEYIQVFDRDGNGFISAAELRHVMTNLGSGAFCM